MSSNTVIASVVPKKKMRIGDIVWGIMKYASVALCAFLAVLPIVSCVITSLKTEVEYQSTNVMTLPENFFNFLLKKLFIRTDLVYTENNI